MARIQTELFTEDGISLAAWAQRNLSWMWDCPGQDAEALEQRFRPTEAPPCEGTIEGGAVGYPYRNGTITIQRNRGEVIARLKWNKTRKGK